MKYFLFILILINTLFAKELSTKSTQQEIEQASIREITTFLAKEMNKSLPKLIDEITQDIQVTTYQGKNLVVYRMINSNNDYFKSMWKDSKMKIINDYLFKDIEGSCKNSMLRFIHLTKDLVVNYKFFDIEKRFLFEYKVEKHHCGTPQQ